MILATYDKKNRRIHFGKIIAIPDAVPELYPEVYGGKIPTTRKEVK